MNNPFEEDVNTKSYFDVYSSLELLHKLEQRKIPDDKLQKEAPFSPKNGDVYLFLIVSSDKQERENKFIEILEDNCLLHKGTSSKINATENELKRTYYKPSTKAKEKGSTFHKSVDVLVKTAFPDILPVVVSYKGDSVTHQSIINIPHGNVREKRAEKGFIRTKKETRDTIKDSVKYVANPSIQRLTREVSSQIIDQNQEVSEKVLESKLPRNKELFKYELKKIRDAKRLFRDELYSVYELCQQEFANIILKFQLYPRYALVFAYPKAFSIVKYLLQQLDYYPQAPFQFAYDTTFKIGKFYLSPILCRNYLLENNPLFPVSFLIHDTRYTECHTLHWDQFASRLYTELDKYIDIIPFTVDREQAISNAITSTFPNRANIVYCRYHLKKNFERATKLDKVALDSNSPRSLKRKDYIKALNSLFDCKTLKEYDICLEKAKEIWSVTHSDYYLKNIHIAYTTHSAPWIVSKYSVFKNIIPTNNLSESYNSTLRGDLKISENTPIDLALFSIYMKCAYETNEMIDTLRGKTVQLFKPNYDYYDKNKKRLNTWAEKLANEEPSAKFPRHEVFIEQIKKLVPFPEKVNEVLPDFGCSQLLLASSIIDNETILYSEDKTLFIIPRFSSQELKFLVQKIFRGKKLKYICSCGSTRNCGHIQAVKKHFGEEQDVPKEEYAGLLRRSPKSKKSGHKVALPIEKTKEIYTFQRQHLSNRDKSKSRSLNDLSIIDSLDSDIELIENEEDKNLSIKQSENIVTLSLPGKSVTVFKDNNSEISPWKRNMDISSEEESMSENDEEMKIDSSDETESGFPFISPKQSSKDKFLCKRKREHLDHFLDEPCCSNNFCPSKDPGCSQRAEVLKKENHSFKKTKVNPEKESLTMSQSSFDEAENMEKALEPHENNSYITRDDFVTLEPESWISDDPLNKFGWYLLKTTDFNMPDYMGSYTRYINLVATITINSFEKVTEKNMFQYKSYEYFFHCYNARLSIMFQILNVNDNHWILLVFCMQSKRIIMFDSIKNIWNENWIPPEKSPGYVPKSFELALKFLMATFLYAGIKDIDNEMKKWKCILSKDTPLQTNSYDCGLHCLMVIYSIINKRPYLLKIERSNRVRAYIYKKLNDLNRKEFENLSEGVNQNPTEFLLIVQNHRRKTHNEHETIFKKVLRSKLLKKVYSENMSAEIPNLFSNEVYGPSGSLNTCEKVKNCYFNRTIEVKTTFYTCISCRNKYHCECLELINRDKNKSDRFFICHLCS